MRTASVAFLFVCIISARLDVAAADGPSIASMNVVTMPGFRTSGTINATPGQSGDVLGYQIYRGPFFGDITFDGATGAYTYTPNTTSGVIDPIGIRVTDQNNVSATADLNIRICTANESRPLIKSRPFDEYILVGALWQHTVAVDSGRLDINNTSLTFSLLDAPAGLTTEQPNGQQLILRWAPTSGQVGTNAVTVKVVDEPTGSCDIQRIPLMVSTTGGGG